MIRATTKRHFKGRPLIFSVYSLLTWVSTANADLFHANNFLIGDRAVGLGGAYAGVADDASGVVYNPAGMAFSLSPKFSGSANAFFRRTITYKDTLESDDFTEISQGSVPAFFGGLQQASFLGEGGAFGFAIYAPDSDSSRQNDLIIKPEIGIKSFHRTLSVQASRTAYSIGAARRFGPNLAFGLAANMLMIDELRQEYQDASLYRDTDGLELTPSETDRGRLLQDTAQNTRWELDVMAMEPVIGTQIALHSNFIVGLSYRHPLIIEQSFTQDIDITSLSRFENSGAPLSPSDIADQSSEEWIDLRSSGVPVFRQNPAYGFQGQPNGRIRIDKPLGGLPSEARLGLAWFASSRILWTTDITYRVAPPVASLNAFKMNDVWNAHMGIETYLTPSWPLRLGLFTNHDSRPELKKNRQNQQDRIDYYGGSLLLTWAPSGTQIGLGTVTQYGTGEAQKVAGTSRIQEVEAFFYSFVISAVSNM